MQENGRPSHTSSCEDMILVQADALWSRSPDSTVGAHWGLKALWQSLRTKGDRKLELISAAQEVNKKRV